MRSKNLCTKNCITADGTSEDSITACSNSNTSDRSKHVCKNNCISTDGIPEDATVNIAYANENIIADETVEPDSITTDFVSINDLQGSFVTSETTDRSEKPIICTVNYSNSFSTYANFFGTSNNEDCNSEIFLLDYLDYADNFRDFFKQYPTVTICTSGKAVSSEIGDLGTKKFGNLTYSTNKFKIEKPVHRVHFISVYSFMTPYTIKLEMGVEFKKNGTKLYLIPFIIQSLTNRQPYAAQLNFSLSITNVIFNPKITFTRDINTKQIICYINFEEFNHRTVNWSSSTICEVNKLEYCLVDLKDYPFSFKQFCKRYPTFTIETSGEINSDSTFGDIGKNKFGEFTYRTEKFSPDTNWEYLIDESDSKLLVYAVKAQIALGFKIKKFKLYLKPYINAYLTSHWPTWRELKVHFEITKLIFHEKMI